MRIGVLALQGGYVEHLNSLKKISGVEGIPVKKEQDLEALEGLIIPASFKTMGGESTAISIISDRLGLTEPLKSFIREKPVWGTCAGLIILSNEIEGQKTGGQTRFGGLDVVVRRNYFGSQNDSFLASISNPLKPETESKVLFIRAPVITQIGNQVETVSKLSSANGEDLVVAVLQRFQNPNRFILGTCFHPELTDDLSWHTFFVEQVGNNINKKIIN